jgi:hypothetical protein
MVNYNIVIAIVVILVVVVVVIPIPYHRNYLYSTLNLPYMIDDNVVVIMIA